MPITKWSELPIEIIQEFEQRQAGRGKAGALIWWATWGVESLNYLEDLDNSESLRSNAINAGHNESVIDISHVKWATQTTITSINQCAAAIGKIYDLPTTKSTWEFDLSNFDLSNKKARQNRQRLSKSVTIWVDETLVNPDYKIVKGIRDALTHKQLLRELFIPGDTRYKDPVSQESFTKHQLIEKSKDLALSRIQSFLSIIRSL